MMTELKPGALAALARYYRRTGDRRQACALAMKAGERDRQTPAVLREIMLNGWYGGRAAWEAGRDAAEALGLSRGVKGWLQGEARQTSRYYLDKIDDLLPSWSAYRIEFDPPPHMVASNPSIANIGHRLLLIQRCISYYTCNTGVHVFEDAPHQHLSRNFMLEVDASTFKTRTLYEIAHPPSEECVRLFEDLRLFEWQGRTWAIAASFDRAKENYLVEQWLVEIEDGWLKRPRYLHFGDWKIQEKNWMPFVDGGKLRFVYAVAPTIVINENAEQVSIQSPRFDGTHFRGSTQLIPYDDGWLAAIRSISRNPTYVFNQHRLAWWNRGMRLERLSVPFHFHTETEIGALEGYQYAMGLAWHPDRRRIVLSYCVDEMRPHLGVFAADDLPALLRSA